MADEDMDGCAVMFLLIILVGGVLGASCLLGLAWAVFKWAAGIPS